MILVSTTSYHAHLGFCYLPTYLFSLMTAFSATSRFIPVLCLLYQNHVSNYKEHASSNMQCYLFVKQLHESSSVCSSRWKSAEKRFTISKTLVLGNGEGSPIDNRPVHLFLILNFVGSLPYGQSCNLNQPLCTIVA